MARIKFAPLQSQAGQLIIQRLNLSGKEIDSVVYITGGYHFLKSTAILHLLKDLGRGWKLFYVFIIVPEFLRNFLYNLIARHRYTIFGKKDICMVPDPDIKDRFL